MVCKKEKWLGIIATSPLSVLIRGQIKGTSVQLELDVLRVLFSTFFFLT